MKVEYRTYIKTWLRLPTYEKLMRELPTSRYSEEEDHGRDMNEQVSESETASETDDGTIKEIGYISNLFAFYNKFLYTIRYKC